MIEALHSSDMQLNQMKGVSGNFQNNIDELHSSDIQGLPMEGKSGVTRSIIG